MPCSKETTTLSNLLTKHPHLNQIHNRFPGPLSQRLLKKTENLKMIDDLYKLPKPDAIMNQNSEFSLQKKEKVDENSQLNSTDKKKPKEFNVSKEKDRALKFFYLKKPFFTKKIIILGKPSHDFSKDNPSSNLQKSSHFNPNSTDLAPLSQGVTKKHTELNNLIRILQQQNNEVVNPKQDQTELQRKIQLMKEKLQNNITRSKEFSKNNNSKQSKAPGFHSHRGPAPKYIKEDEYLLIQKEEKKSKEMVSVNSKNNMVSKEIPNEIVDLYLLTNENSGLEHNSINRISVNVVDPIIHSKKPANLSHNLIATNNNNNNNNSRSLNESDLEKLLNNPNIQPSNKRMDFQNFNLPQKNTVSSLLNAVKQQKFEKIDQEKHKLPQTHSKMAEKTTENMENILGRKFSLDEKKYLTNHLEHKAKKIGKSEVLQQDLNFLKERITNTLGRYRAKTEKLKEINLFLYNKIKRDGMV